MSETRELAGQRAFEIWVERTELGWTWRGLEEDERETFRRVADAVLATLDWQTDSAIIGRIDDLEERVRKLEKRGDAKR